MKPITVDGSMPALARVDLREAPDEGVWIVVRNGDVRHTINVTAFGEGLIVDVYRLDDDGEETAVGTVDCGTLDLR